MIGHLKCYYILITNVRGAKILKLQHQVTDEKRWTFESNRNFIKSVVQSPKERDWVCDSYSSYRFDHQNSSPCFLAHTRALKQPGSGKREKMLKRNHKQPPNYGVTSGRAKWQCQSSVITGSVFTVILWPRNQAMKKWLSSSSRWGITSLVALDWFYVHTGDLRRK